MTSGSRCLRILRTFALCMVIASLLGACTREMRGTLRDLGIPVEEPAPAPATPSAAPAAAPAVSTTPAPTVAVNAPAATVPSPAAATTSAPAAPTMAAPAPVAAAPPAPAVAAATTAATTPTPPAAAIAPAKAPVPLGDLHSGWIAGSIGEIPQKMLSLVAAGSPYGLVRIGFHNVSGGKHGNIEFSTALIKPTELDVASEQEKSAVFAINLPVGDYVIDSLHFTGSDDLYSRNCKVDRKIAVPFKVKPGTVNYLGALITSADWGSTRFGPEAPLCGYFVVQDRSTRDEPIIRQRYAQLSGPLQVDLLAANSPTAEKFFRAH